MLALDANRTLLTAAPCFANALTAFPVLTSHIRHVSSSNGLRNVLQIHSMNLLKMSM